MQTARNDGTKKQDVIRSTSRGSICKTTYVTLTEV